MKPVFYIESKNMHYSVFLFKTIDLPEITSSVKLHSSRSIIKKQKKQTRMGNISFICQNNTPQAMCPYYPFIKLFIQKHKLQPVVDVLLFAIIIYSFHLLWWKGDLEHFLSRFAAFDQAEEFLAHQVFLPAAFFVKHIIGYDIHTIQNTLLFPNNGYIAVERSCSGLKQFYQWFFLILLFPGPWKHKTWFIPMGILVIHGFNIVRIIFLSVVIMNWPAHWGFIHMWVMRPMYYVVMFLLWVIWVEKFKDKRKDTSR